MKKDKKVYVIMAASCPDVACRCEHIETEYVHAIYKNEDKADKIATKLTEEGKNNLQYWVETYKVQ